MALPLREFTRFIWRVQYKCWAAFGPSRSAWANRSTYRQLLSLHSPSPFTAAQLESWYSVYHPTEGRRLSRPGRLAWQSFDVLVNVVNTFPVFAVILWYIFMSCFRRHFVASVDVTGLAVDDALRKVQHHFRLPVTSLMMLMIFIFEYKFCLYFTHLPRSPRAQICTKFGIGGNLGA